MMPAAKNRRTAPVLVMGAVLLCAGLTVLALIAGWLAPTPAWADDAPPEPIISADGRSASIDDGTCDLAVTDFQRQNKGTSKQYQDKDYGYRYPMAAENAFAIVVVPDGHCLVYLGGSGEYLPEGVNATFWQLLQGLDSANSSGGQQLAQLYQNYQLVEQKQAEYQGFIYSFAVEVESGYYYVTVAPAASNPNGDASHAAAFVLTGSFAPFDATTITTAPTGWAAFVAFLTSMDYRPFWVSMKTSLVALVIVFILGLIAARLLMNVKSRLKDVLDSIFTIPMVLPPTVCGFLLLVLFGKSTSIGQWLIQHGIELVFTWPMAVIAATVVSFPLMYRTARGAFEALDPALADAARTLGWGEGRIFIRLMLPLAWPSIAAGTVLAFARALGEFGATMFVAGNYPGVTQTMPIAIYFEWMGGHSDVATFWVFVVILISFIVILFINWYASRTQRYRKKGSE
ncbi:MAG: molybdate ABC transporter permease subunit [Coriobacteriales bacterium]|jgi:molybdate transport system permease protein|nr:molybdate ABC transporter permease subunit [Coriobacteriales bacterium]